MFYDVNHIPGASEEFSELWNEHIFMDIPFARWYSWPVGCGHGPKWCQCAHTTTAVFDIHCETSLVRCRKIPVMEMDENYHLVGEVFALFEQISKYCSMDLGSRDVIV